MNYVPVKEVLNEDPTPVIVFYGVPSTKQQSTNTSKDPTRPLEFNLNQCNSH